VRILIVFYVHWYFFYNSNFEPNSIRRHQVRTKLSSFFVVRGESDEKVIWWRHWWEKMSFFVAALSDSQAFDQKLKLSIKRRMKTSNKGYKASSSYLKGYLSVLRNLNSFSKDMFALIHLCVKGMYVSFRLFGKIL